MSTSAAIGVVQADGTIKATFLMHDGSGVSAATILPGWYNSQEKADALLALGPLYKLGTKIAPDPDTHHSFKKPQPDVVLAFIRDRDRFRQNEPCSYHIFKNREDFAKKAPAEMRVTTLHLFENGGWLYRSEWMKPKQWYYIEVVFVEDKK